MKVNIASSQYPITYHTSFQAWKKHVTDWVEKGIRQKAQLLLFPEYGSMELVSLFNKEIQGDIERQVLALDTLRDDFCAVWAGLARKYEVIIIAPSIPVLEDGKPVNRTFVFSGKGLNGYQDKFFMTRFENEIWGIQSGKKQLSVFEADWGSFGIQICYDVEFPIGAQLLAENGARLLLAPSCTETIRGATRVHIGARARAMENQVYTVVSQTINEALWSPAVDINYGFAAVYSTPDHQFPEEGIVQSMDPQKEGWLNQSLDLSLLEQVRKNGQVFNFKDSGSIEMKLKDTDIKMVKYRV